MTFTPRPLPPHLTRSVPAPDPAAGPPHDRDRPPGVAPLAPIRPGDPGGAGADLGTTAADRRGGEDWESEGGALVRDRDAR